MISDDGRNYSVIPATPATGILYITENSPGFISGHLRMRGKKGGKYPYNYLEMLDNIFGVEDNTIEVCSGSIAGRNFINRTSTQLGTSQLSLLPLSHSSCFTVDINPNTNADYVCDGQQLEGIPDNTFNRWRCDPPYNLQTARAMYGTELPLTSKLLKAGARVCRVGSLMFLLLGPQNYQICPIGVKRFGWIAITVVPNNEIRCLNIYYKYADA